MLTGVEVLQISTLSHSLRNVFPPGPTEMSSSEFISEGWSRVGGSAPNGVERLAVDQVKLVPAPEVRHGTGEEA